MGNPFVHVELNTGDAARAKKFYKGLFDWNLQDMKIGDGTYTTIDVGKVKQGTGGGLQQSPMPGSPPLWLSYVAVDDVKKTIARAQKLGAQIIEPYMEIPGMGALGMFTDPTGAMLGVWQAAMPQKPAARRAAAKKPAARKPAAKKPAARKPAARKPAARKPAAARNKKR